MARVIPPRRLALRVGVIVSILVTWEAVTIAGIVPIYFLPPLSEVAERIYQDISSGELIYATYSTLVRTLTGFGVAASVGVAVGVMIARIPLVRWFCDPLVSIGLPLPKIAFLPIFVLWFGVFEESKILMIAFSAVFPVIVSAWAGTEHVDKLMLWSASSFGAGPHRQLWEIVLPAALPQIFTGLQIALPIAMIVAIVTEMTLEGQGLGAMTISAMRYLDSVGVFEGLLAISIVGSVLIKVMEVLRRYILVWHQETAVA